MSGFDSDPSEAEARGRAELVHRNQELGAILEDSLNEIYVFDPETLRFTLVNRGARENLGYSMQELLALTPVGVSPEFTLESYRALLSPLRTGEKARIAVTTVQRRKDGSLYPVEVHFQYAPASEPRAFVAIALDITERRSQEEAIEEAAARARVLLRTAADAIITINAAGVIEAVNAATLKSFGFEESELIGQNVRILMPAPHAEAHDGYLERYIRTGEAHIIGKGRELEALRKDGSIFPIRLSVGEALFDDQRLFTAFIHDLTGQRQAEEERDELDKRLRALFNQRTSLTGICTLEGVLLEANQASLDYVGIQRSDAVGQLFWETRWWSHDPALQSRLRKGLADAAEGEFVRFGATHPRGDESLGTMDFSITPVRDNHGRVDVLLVESIDVTETRSLQAQLVQSQKMEAIGTLAGGIAHDFNNLLTAIRGSSEILVDHLEPGSRLKRSAERIMRAADRAAALTTRILGFSRQQVTQRRTLELNSVISETRELFVRALPEDLELKMDLCEEDLYVRADESQMGQVLMNLIVNAGDAMPAGGTLWLISERQQVDPRRAEALGVAPGSFAILVVRDSGTGIPSDALAKIFDPFFTTKEPGKGTGLGLSMVSRIVLDHGGSIDVKSEVGVGTTFTVLLPEVAAPARESAATERARPRARAGGETILLVEDDEIMRDLLVEVLEEEGYVVVPAAGPEEALAEQHAADGGIDLVITDVVMPMMSGFLLAKELRAHHANLRVLYMSGYTDQVLADRGELGDEDPFIRKPFGNDSLLGKIREVLDAAPRLNL